MRTLIITALIAATPLAAHAGQCPAPKFAVGDFKTADGKADLGFPGGVSLVDADGDGDIDVMATHGFDVTAKKYIPDRSMLYLNDGRGNFTRAETSALSNADGPASGSTWADIDDDGDLDAFVSNELGALDAFYRNQGNGRFEKQELGDATKTKGGNFTSSWADIDGDGDLDLYVGGPTLEPPAPALVYRNDNGAFVRVTDTPLDNGANNPGAALWADIDNDGDQDLLLANSDIARRSDMAPAPVEHAVIYRNDGNWRFTRATGNAFEDVAFPAAGAALGDVDNDGDLDVLIGLYDNGKTKKRDRLFLNDGKGRFTEAKDLILPEHTQLTFAVAIADLNLDGNLDLITASYDERILIYTGDGRGKFSRVSDPALERKRAYSSLATGDINGDGKPDILIGDWAETSTGAPMTALINQTPACGSWSEVVLKNGHGAPNPPGARVTLVTRATNGAERRQLREASAQTGMRALSANAFLFGVPDGETVVAAEVRWPNGKTERVTKIAANGKTVVQEGR